MGGTNGESQVTTHANLVGSRVIETHGMIDAHAHHSSFFVWPERLKYARSKRNRERNRERGVLISEDQSVPLELIDGRSEIVREIPTIPTTATAATIPTTDQIAQQLVNLNTAMYNRFSRALNSGKQDIPSLIISPTMDMELAHRDGYDRKFIETTRIWNAQINDTEAAVVANPLRFFPLFSYDPRRYRYAGDVEENIKLVENLRSSSPAPTGHISLQHNEQWDYPFARIVGHNHRVPVVDESSRVWLGFCMNPLLGFRPFDEYCTHLMKFYRECNNKHIPILTHCAPEGIISHEANSYKYNFFDLREYIERMRKSDSQRSFKGTVYSDMYSGQERVVSDKKLDHFYRNYGHPRNWIPVLKHYPNLRLCLAHFGGNGEWQHGSMKNWGESKDKSLPQREWIRCIVKLTRYKNVYADISGLNIDPTHNPRTHKGLQKMISLIQDGHEEFKHLRYKLIFGSNWYFTYLTDNANRINHDYSKYCSDMRELFRDADRSGELWERVSLINPWNFYGLSNGAPKNKISDICATLGKIVGDGDSDKAINDVYKKIFDGTEGLIKYIADCNTKDMKEEEQTITESLKLNVEGDKDLEAYEGLRTGKASCGKNREEIVKECRSCGFSYRDEIYCRERYGKYGPKYDGVLPLEHYGGWDELIEKGEVTEDERKTMIGMAANEGNLDSVQSYDSEIVTVGAMQKTINIDGIGEFVVQMAKFSKYNLDKYKLLFEKCGWSLDEDNVSLRRFRQLDGPDRLDDNEFEDEALQKQGGLKAFYRDAGTNKKLTGIELRNRIREGFTAGKRYQKVACIPIEPLINAACDPCFQLRQVKDFIQRLRKVLELKIRYDGNVYPLSAYLKSKLGKAMVLDHHINAPSNVLDDFKKALNKLYKKIEITKDPNKWGKSHSKYEHELIGYYADVRRGTDMGNGKGREHDLRYQKMIKNPFLKEN